MSPLLLRAVVAAGAGAVLPLRGTADPDRRLAFVEAGRVGVWASRFEAPPELGRAELLAHHALVEAICAAVPCLPVRLGTWADSEEAARRLLAAREEPLVAALARVEGRVEVAVSWVWREESAGTQAGGHASVDPAGGTVQGPDTGRRYLLARRSAISRQDARQARAAELVRLVESAAGVAGAAALHRLAPSEALALSSALLVDRAAAGAAIERLRAVGRGQADVELLVNGPWPPYSFAGI